MWRKRLSIWPIELALFALNVCAKHDGHPIHLAANLVIGVLHNYVALRVQKPGFVTFGLMTRVGPPNGKTFALHSKNSAVRRAGLSKAIESELGVPGDICIPLVQRYLRPALLEPF
jgi:hypothetical protein